MGLCAALAVAVVVIVVLVLYRGKGSESGYRSPSPPHQRLPPPPRPQQPPAAQPQAPPAQPQAPPKPGAGADYESTVGSGKPALVMFYADWCGHSKNMLPAWQQIEQALNQSGQFEAIALEQKKHSAEMQKHGVRGFPDIRFYPDGFPSQNAIPYRGNRSPESLMKFVQSGGQET